MNLSEISARRHLQGELDGSLLLCVETNFGRMKKYLAMCKVFSRHLDFVDPDITETGGGEDCS